MIYDIEHEIKKRQAIAQQRLDFSKIKVGTKTVEDAILNLGDLKRTNPSLGDKATILRVINDNNYSTMRQISNYFFRTSGIYSRLCKYMAYLFKYDWIVTPFVQDSTIGKEKILKNFYKALITLENFDVKCFCNDVALKVVKNGCYYGYIVPTAEKINIQELPVDYCRSRYKINGVPLVEFQMKFFDDYFKTAEQKMKILSLFPKEFLKGYKLYKANKLLPQFSGDTSGWFALDYNCTVKFNLNDSDAPLFMSVIPAIIELDEALDLDRKKMQQQLLKIVVQQMPLDKNGDLIFDVDEIAELHSNAVAMLGQRAVGLDVLTTMANVSVESLTDNSAINTSKESVANAKAAVFDQGGVSAKQFNTDSNIAIDRSISNDEALMQTLVNQFQDFLNRLLKPLNKNRNTRFSVYLLPTTIYNYKELAKMYKDQTAMGYSKMLPQIALGQTQSAILATAYFENDILDLVNMFIPPLTSNTINPDILNRKSENKEGAGRPTKESQGESVSDKTLANRESQG